MQYKELPSQEYLKECFTYDEETGILTWKERPLYHFQNEHRMKLWNSKMSGKVSGFLSKQGYLCIRLSGLNYQIHRIIWKWMTGEDPKEEIDHINNIKDDNRWCNLRETDKFQNKYNRVKNKNNTTGYKGVMTHKDKFKSAIKVDGKFKYLGLFDTAEEAYEAYCKAAKELHGEFANFG